MKIKNKEIKVIFTLIVLTFAGFLILPVIRLLLKSFIGTDGFTLEFYSSVLKGKGHLKALGNSFQVAGASALITTILAFLWHIPSITVTYRTV